MYLSPIYGEDDDGHQQILQYRIVLKNDNSESVVANRDLEANLVHVVANGRRYMIDLNTYNVSRLEFKKIEVSTVDFQTAYGYAQLLDNLWSNIRQYMMNLTLQTLMSNSADDGKVTFAPEHSVGLYLDLFTDQFSLDSYCLASG